MSSRPNRLRAGRSLYAYLELTRLCRLPWLQPYAGLTFRITLHFPANYPYTAPTIKFVTPCFHPNVALPGGDICLDILKARPRPI